MPFSRPLARLRAPRFRGVGLTLLALAWAAWAAFVPVGVHALSVEARVVPEADPVALALPVAGRLATVDVHVGDHVEAGATLAALVAQADELAAAEAEVAGLTAERDALGHRDVAGAGAATLDAAERAIVEARGLASAARAEEERATAEARRLGGLDGVAAVAPAEREDADVAARRATALREAADGVLAQRIAEARARAHGADNDVGEQTEAMARLDKELAVATARRDAARRDVEERTLRAPVAGTIAEVAPRGAGAVVAVGEVLATLVPDGALRVVATFPEDVVGRVAPGQAARLRARAFDWMRWGSVPLTVTTAASAPRDGGVRVELGVAGETRVPLRAGLVGEVDVELERATPLTLLLRAAGALAER